MWCWREAHTARVCSLVGPAISCVLATPPKYEQWNHVWPGVTIPHIHIHMKQFSVDFGHGLHLVLCMFHSDGKIVLKTAAKGVNRNACGHCDLERDGKVGI